MVKEGEVIRTDNETAHYTELRASWKPTQNGKHEELHDSLYLTKKTYQFFKEDNLVFSTNPFKNFTK